MINTGIYTHDGLPVRDLFTALADAAAAGLAQTPDGVPAVFGFHHDQPPEDCDDALWLWVREWVPVTAESFPNAVGAVQVCDPVDFVPRVVLTLRRPCAPILDAAGQVDQADETAAANDLAIDIRALTCAVAATWPGLLQASYPTAGRMFYGPQTPAGRSTNLFGWDWEILLEINGCRAACGG